MQIRSFSTTSNRVRFVLRFGAARRSRVSCVSFSLPAADDDDSKRARTILLWATNYINRIVAFPRIKSRKNETNDVPTTCFAILRNLSFEISFFLFFFHCLRYSCSSLASDEINKTISRNKSLTQFEIKCKVQKISDFPISLLSRFANLKKSYMCRYSQRPINFENALAVFQSYPDAAKIGHRINRC